MIETQFILYVKDQEIAKTFYEYVLNTEVELHVPGMTEFRLGKSVKLGLMPNKGIAKIISPIMPYPDLGQGIPRCELYLKVDDPQACLDRAIGKGATLIEKLEKRDWGDTVGYVADPDGHVIAFAKA